jgi:hypothetical protein
MFKSPITNLTSTPFQRAISDDSSVGLRLLIFEKLTFFCRNVNLGYTFSEEFSSRLNLNEKLVKTHLGEKGVNIQTGGHIRGKTFTSKIFLSGPVSMESDKAFEVLKQFPGQTKTRNLTKPHSDTF